MHCCSFADLQKPQVELDGKACAAVGQGSLMAIYDALFTQVIGMTRYLFFSNCSSICLYSTLFSSVTLFFSLAFTCCISFCY